MIGRRSLALILVGLSVLLFSAVRSEAKGKHTTVTSVGGYSSQTGKNKAVVGSRITVGTTGSTATGRPSTGSAGAGSRNTGPEGSASPVDQVPVPTLSSDSPLLQNPAPAGPGSLWYQALGQSCIYIPDSSALCYAIVYEAAPSPPDVPAKAAQLADQLVLTLAGIEASPGASRDGLTGAASWFWLESGPSEQQNSITLDGETVTVTADPSQISWSFGDGTGLNGGAGVPYRTGVVPAEAIRHVYQTRCLPGDLGHDPYVLASCQANGYHLSAETTWTISYTGTGPVTQRGELASRSTESDLVYPVSEARAFLTGGRR